MYNLGNGLYPGSEICSRRTQLRILGSRTQYIFHSRTPEEERNPKIRINGKQERIKEWEGSLNNQSSYPQRNHPIQGLWNKPKPTCNGYGYADSHTAVWDVHFLSTVNKSNMEIASKSEWNNWDEIDWVKVDSSVFKLQKRIYRASQAEDYKLVHKLQKLMVKSWYGKLLAVRKVTQENKGSAT